MPLTKREAIVLSERMNGETLSEIGKKTLNTTTGEIGISKERVRAIVRNACWKTRFYATRKGWFQ